MSDEASLGEAVNRAARLLRRLADQRLAPFGLSAGYLPVLTVLMREDLASQKALTERAGIGQPTMAATLARMERDGIIERQPDTGDKRSVLFKLTAAARLRAPDVEAAVRDLNADAIADLPESDRERLRQLLEIVAGSVERRLADRPDEHPRA